LKVTYICVTFKLRIMQKEILQKWFFQQPPSEVWEYLTQAELIEQWLAKTDFKPVVGQKFQFTNSCKSDDNKPHYTYCKVLEIIPCKLLSYSWRKGTNEKEISVDSVVTWTLTDKNGGTELILQHNGFTLIEDTIAHTNGWNECLNKIIDLLNSSTNANTNS
jgi:uncharacterized protein YndB with AHSA1/START domain